MAHFWTTLDFSSNKPFPAVRTLLPSAEINPLCSASYPRFSSILYRYKIQNSFPSKIITIWFKATMQTLFLTGQEWPLHYAFEPELSSKLCISRYSKHRVYFNNNIWETPQAIQATNIWKATTYLNSDYTAVLWVLPSPNWRTYKWAQGLKRVNAQQRVWKFGCTCIKIYKVMPNLRVVHAFPGYWAKSTEAAVMGAWEHRACDQINPRMSLLCHNRTILTELERGVLKP